MRQLRLKKKSVLGAQIVLKVFPGVFSSQKKPETYLQRVHTTKSKLSNKSFWKIEKITYNFDSQLWVK